MTQVSRGSACSWAITASASRMSRLRSLSNRPVFTSQWDAREPNNMPHINLSREADAILIAPCSADFMARLVHGRADELLSLMCLARPVDRVPLLVAPAMNREMWAHPATQRNMRQLAEQLSDRGVQSLRYDKVGTGKTGLGPYQQRPNDVVSAVYTKGADAAVRYLSDTGQAMRIAAE